MEEVEQICSRIAIMDKGKVIATGTKDELKSMIEIGEKISVEIFNPEEYILKDIQKIGDINSVDYENNLLVIKSKRGTNNLTNVLDYLKDNKISYGRIYSELPTLNDVFLEITGKHLRD
jgi:ABC-2 type transport system ATP-binding protein